MDRTGTGSWSSRAARDPRGPASVGIERALFHHDDIEVVEHPNKLNPTGKRYDKAALRAAGERGKALLASEHYAIRSMIVEGERAAVMTVWTGIVNDGRQLTAQICSIIEFRDGKVWRQEQFDCFA
ncbi:MAG: nuclear transport factor 2 family protein [Myxococcales bacterium]|nr:nuclear transport factor 2 family protein [Myxococcales bacterium]